jgi:hypothetical protein
VRILPACLGVVTGTTALVQYEYEYGMCSLPASPESPASLTSSEPGCSTRQTRRARRSSR